MLAICGLVMPIARSQARKAMPPIQKAAHLKQTYEGTLEMLQGPEKKEGLKGPLCGGLKQADGDCFVLGRLKTRIIISLQHSILTNTTTQFKMYENLISQE